MLNNCPKVGKKNNPTCGNRQSQRLARKIMMQHRLFEYIHVYMIVYAKALINIHNTRQSQRLV